MPFKGDLYPFQVTAVERMLERRRLLVAFEMGLGKTVIAINAIEQLLDDDRVRAGLVVTKASLKYQWAKAIERFTGGMAEVLVIDGPPRKRAEQYERAQKWGEYLILNYEQVVNDWQQVKRLPIDFVICDEVTAIKSFRAKRSRRVKRLQYPYLFGLTGQPVENRPEEVFSIMEWVDKRVLGRFDIFDRTFIKRNRFGGVVAYKKLPLLHKRLAEAMIRCTREEVADQLPAVIEPDPRLIPFDTAGARLYRHIVKDLLHDLEEAGALFGGSFDLWALYHGEDSPQRNAMRGRIMSKLTCLRMLCDHPELLRLSATRHDSDDDGGSAYAAELAQAGLLEGLTRAPKFAEAVELVRELLDANPNNKIVLFSFFKPTLRWLHDALSKYAGAVLFTGDMAGKARQAAIDAFETDPATRVFLSSDAGGHGVDLPAGNYLISYDLPWSAGQLDQRNARIVRLSSEHKSVTILSLLMAGSTEEYYASVLEQKRRVAAAVVDGKGFDKTGGLTVDLATLREFLANSSV